MGNKIMKVICIFRCADLRFDVVNEDSLAPCTTTEDAAVVWADSHAKDAIVTVLRLHLNWTRIGIADKDFIDFPQSLPRVYSNGDQEGTIGREGESKNWFSVELNVDGTKRMLRRAEKVDSESVRRSYGLSLITMMTTSTTRLNSRSLTITSRRRFAIRSSGNSSDKSSVGWAESWSPLIRNHRDDPRKNWCDNGWYHVVKHFKFCSLFLPLLQMRRLSKKKAASVHISKNVDCCCCFTLIRFCFEFDSVTINISCWWHLISQRNLHE